MESVRQERSCFLVSMGSCTPAASPVPGCCSAQWAVADTKGWHFAAKEKLGTSAHLL